MASSMFHAAREIALTSIRERTPGLTAVEERVQLFLRFYEADLTPGQVSRIVHEIRARGAAPAQHD